MAAVNKTESPKAINTSATTTAGPITVRTFLKETDSGIDKKKVVIAAAVALTLIVALVLWKR